MAVLRLLTSAFAYAVTAVDTVVMGSWGTLVGPIPPRGDRTREAARLWARIILWSTPVRLRVESTETIPVDTPLVFMANHESWLDIPALLVAIPGQVRFLAKKSLFPVPFLGWAMRAMGFIPVDRKNRRDAVRSFEQAAERIRDGRPVLVFPEETRSTTEKLLPFQRGGFLIALKAHLPIVPVGLEGPRHCLPKYSYLLRPGTITVRFGSPIATEGLGVTAKSELIERTRAAIERLRGPAAAG